MTRRRTWQDRARVSGAALLLLLIWTATNAAAQAGDDDQTAPADTGDAAAQSDTSGAGSENGSSDSEPAMPSLDTMLRIALEHNPDIRAARAEVAVAEANLDRTRLTVVKDLTAYRDRWLSARASLTSAEQELAVAEARHSEAAVPFDVVMQARTRVSAVQLKLREIEAEIPFLLGTSLDDEDVQTATSGVESQTALLKDKAIPLAEQLVALSLELYRTGRGDAERCLMWSSRLIQLQLDTAESERERKVAMDGHQNRLREIRDIAQARFQAARGTMEDVLAAEFAMVEAKAMLNRAGVE